MSLQQPPLGRFADPDKAAPDTDPRMDPRVLKACRKLGNASRAQPVPMTRANTPIDGLVALSREFDKGFDSMFNTIVEELPPETGEGIEYTLEHVKNPADGYEIELHIHRPAGHPTSKPLPGIAYIHGGGMVMLPVYAAPSRHWVMDLARHGAVSIAVGFRNGNHDGPAGGKYKHCPFPIGLDDCVVALRWISENRARLGIGKLVVQGESGGANLCVASTLKLLRDGHHDVVDGVYAMEPYISGAYGKSEAWKLEHGLTSLVECDGYFMNCAMMDILVAIYDPEDKHETDPLAWPWHATEADLKAFPPSAIVVDELDPLRDEGLALARKMTSAGVDVYTRMNLGMLHTTELWKPSVPGTYDMTITDIKRFADKLG